MGYRYRLHTNARSTQARRGISIALFAAVVILALALPAQALAKGGGGRSSCGSFKSSKSSPSSKPSSKPSNIGSPAPSSKPGSSGSQSSPSASGSPSNISGSAPAAKPTVASNPQTKQTDVNYGDRSTSYRQSPGGVYVPSGASAAPYYGYHYGWWLPFAASPYNRHTPAGYQTGVPTRASPFGTLGSMMLVSGVLGGAGWLGYKGYRRLRSPRSQFS